LVRHWKIGYRGHEVENGFTASFGYGLHPAQARSFATGRTALSADRTSSAVVSLAIRFCRDDYYRIVIVGRNPLAPTGLFLGEPIIDQSLLVIDNELFGATVTTKGAISLRPIVFSRL
jgi:hypothetical protein